MQVQACSLNLLMNMFQAGFDFILLTFNLNQYGLFLKTLQSTVWGHYVPPPPPHNFVVFDSIMTKFGVVIEFDKFSPNSQKQI